MLQIKLTTLLVLGDTNPFLHVIFEKNCMFPFSKWKLAIACHGRPVTAFSMQFLS